MYLKTFKMKSLISKLFIILFIFGIFISFSGLVKANSGVNRASIMTVSPNELSQYLDSISNNITKAEELISENEDNLYDVELSESKSLLIKVKENLVNLQNLKLEIDSLSSGSIKDEKLIEFEDLVTDLEDDLYLINLYMYQSSNVEARGIWHRPNVTGYEITLSGIERFLDQLVEGNINMLFLETFWEGFSMFPTEKLNTTPHPSVFTGYYGEEYGRNYYKALITEAHKRGIEVHAWCEIFLLGLTSNIGANSTILTDHPDWLATTYEGGYVQTGKNGDEEGFMFLDPANPEVREFINSYLTELVETYDIDGIQLDYIRYPSEHSKTLSSGYTDYAVNKFLDEYNHSGEIKTLISDPTIYEQWKDFRADQVTDTVEGIFNLIREIDKEITLSIAVGPDATHAKNFLMQDWETWVKNGWIDIVAPMAYRTYDSAIYQIVDNMNTLTGNRTYNYTGLASSYMGMDALVNATQIKASKDAGALGSVIFATQNYVGKDDVKKVLSNSTHRDMAVTPHSPVDVIVNAQLDEIEYLIDNLYLPSGKMTIDEKDKLASLFNEIREMPTNNADDYHGIYFKLYDLGLNINEYVKGTTALRIQEKIIYLKNIIDIKITRYLINYGYWDPTERLFRPNTSEFSYPEIPDNEVINDDTSNDNSTELILYIGSSVALVGFISFYIIKKQRGDF